MVVNKRTKESRAKGGKTRGWGHKKKRRGAGNRGGRGNAGSGKRADSRKPIAWQKDFGRKYFVSHRKQGKAINLIQLEKQFPKETEVTINLTEQGYTKLLASGNITKKFKITVSQFSVKAKEKVEAAGGSIEGPVKKDVKEE